MLEVDISTPSARDLERIGELGPSIDAAQDAGVGGFYARVADQPIALKLRTIASDVGVATASDLYDRFEPWLVPHRMSVLRRAGLAEPVSIGIEVEYETNGATCSVSSLIPAPEFVVHGSLGLKTSYRGGLSAAGEATPLEIAGPLPLAKGAISFGAETQGHLAFEWRATVATARIQAVGIGDSRCEWRFDRAEDPLYGRDIETWSVLILPKYKRELVYRMRFYIIFRTLFVPTRRQSEWCLVNCQLHDGA